MKTGKIGMLAGLLTLAVGCATQKESHTPRTGVEQLLVSSAIDQCLDRVDLSVLRDDHIFLDTKYLDCVDKNYIIVSLHNRLLNQGAKLVDKAEAADVIVEVASGAVGTDGQETFVGIPEIPLPPPSPIAIPKLAFFQRTRLNGTAKLLVVAYEAKSKRPIISSGSALARSDQDSWHLLGAGAVQSGSVATEIAEANQGVDLSVTGMMNLARKTIAPTEKPLVLPASNLDAGPETESVTPASIKSTTP